MAFECDNGEIIINAKPQLYSPDGTIIINKVSDCSFNLDVAGASTGVSILVMDGQTTTALGNGTAERPLSTELKLSPNPSNALRIIPGEGLFAEGLSYVAANNGLSESGGMIQFGNDLGKTEAKLLSHREIPMTASQFFYFYTGSGGTWGVGFGIPAGTLPTARLHVAGDVRFVGMSGAGTKMVTVSTLGVLSYASLTNYVSEKTYYVSRNFGVNPAAVTVTGLAKAAITSTNPDYNTQLSKAIRGSREYTFPCPWSARNAALAAITAGELTDARIVILEDNVYTVGSDDPTKNGSTTSPYPANGAEVADIGVSSANATSIASLLQDKVYYEFREGSGLKYICSKYNVYLGYQRQVDFSDPLFKSSISGRGFFHRLYGEAQGFADNIILVDNANAIVSFEAKEISLNMQKGFTIYNCAEFHANIDMVYSADSILLYTTSSRATTQYTKYSNITFKVKEYIGGYQQSLYPQTESSDWWEIFTQGVSLFPKTVTVEMDNAINYIDGRGGELYSANGANYPEGYTGNTNVYYTTGLVFHLKIGNYKEIVKTPVGSINPGATIRTMFHSRDKSVDPNASTNLSSHNNVLFEFKHANIVAPLLTASCGIAMEGVNNVLIFRSDKCIKDNVNCTTVGMFYMNCVQGRNPLDRTHVIVEGWFEDKQRHIFTDNFQANSTWGYTRVTLRGKFIARTAGMRIIDGIGSTNNRINYILDGAVLINDGTTTIISAMAAGTMVLCTSAVINAPLGPNIQPIGNGIVYDSAIGTYY